VKALLSLADSSAKPSHFCYARTGGLESAKLFSPGSIVWKAIAAADAPFIIYCKA